MTPGTPADQEVLKKFRDFSRTLQDLLEIIREISNIVDKIVTRVEALVNPTTQVKLMAISAPSMQTLSNQMMDKQKELESLKKEARVLVDELQEVLESGQVRCPDCEGQGEIEEATIQREDNFIIPSKEYYTCPTCRGRGKIAISDEIRSNCREVMRGLRFLWLASSDQGLKRL